MINSILQAAVVISLAIAFGVFFGYRMAVSEKREIRLSNAYELPTALEAGVS